MHRTKRTRRKNAAQIALDLAAARQAAREKAGRERAETRHIDKQADRWGPNTAALALPANADVTGQNRAGQPRPVRKDIFVELYERRRDGGRGDRCLPQASFDAVQRLEGAMVSRLGLGETPDATGGRGFGPRTLVNDRMLDAGDEVNGITTILDVQAMALLSELLEPRIVHTAVPQRWRLVVWRITGTKAEAAQANTVRQVCDALATAYVELDRRRAQAGWRPRGGQITALHHDSSPCDVLPLARRGGS